MALSHRNYGAAAANLAYPKYDTLSPDCPSQPYDCPTPERQGLTTTVEQLYQTAADTLNIAERLGVILDPQQSNGAQCAEGKNSVAPHFCDYIDLAADRLHATNRILNRLVDFVGR